MVDFADTAHIVVDYADTARIVVEYADTARIVVDYMDTAYIVVDSTQTREFGEFLREIEKFPEIDSACSCSQQNRYNFVPKNTVRNGVENIVTLFFENKFCSCF